MTAQISNFPSRDKINWIHIEPHVRSVALERCSGHQGIAERVVDVVRGVYERVPVSFELQGDSVDAVRVQCVEMLNKISGLMIFELTAIATDAEMLSLDHDPSHAG